MDGHVRVDHSARSGAADDFGHIVHHYPMAVLRPGSVADVADTVGYCRDRGLSVSARGRGHSTHGQAQVEDGVVIETGAMRAVRVGAGRVTVEAGASWSEVLNATLPHGLTPPVLTDYLDLSVGGTLAVGGVGGTSYRHGAQVDNVLDVEVVTGAGQRTVCSPTRRADLFRVTLAGLGQCAIVVSATLRLVPAPTSVRRYQLFYPTVAALTADQRRVVRDGRFSYVEGQAQAVPDGSGRWGYLLEAATFARGSTPPDDEELLGGLAYERGTEQIDDLGYFDFLNRLDEGVAYLKSTGEWYHPHPWWNVFLPDTAVDSFVSSVMADLTLADIGPSGAILLYPLRRTSLTAALLRIPDEPVVFLFSMLKTSSPGALSPAAMVDAGRARYERVLAAGGTRYPIDSVPMSRRDWRFHFGPAWPALAAAKRRYDPDNILTPGQGIFVRDGLRDRAR